MGKTELAANLFRVTQTEDKIQIERIHGQQALERTAKEVGRKVRNTMIEISGRRPENLAPAEDIKEVHKKLKSSHRQIRKIDKPAATPAQLPPSQPTET
jgi:DNA-damage-inducible protein D